jgi:hypothetical protein
VTGRCLAILIVAGACAPEDDATRQAEDRRAAAAADSGFSAVQDRGAMAMGVDQYTSTHYFQPLPDGGRIELQRDSDDPAGRDQIVRHMGEIKDAFQRGDFTLPGFVHARAVPGTAVMSARSDAIAYAVETLPRGAALRLTTGDSAAVAAIHQFLAFQRQDHRAGMHHGE